MDAVRFVTSTACVCTFLLFIGSAAHAHGHDKSTHVSTADELVAAINDANAKKNPAEIVLAPGTYSFTQTFPSDFGPSVLPPVSTPISIRGAGAQVTTLSGSDLGARIVTVLEGGKLSLSGVTLDGGVAICQIFNGGGPCQFGGGGIGNFGGFFELNGCVVNGVAFGPEGEGTLGGGVLNNSGTFLIENSRISGGVRGNGGALDIVEGRGVIDRSIVNNSTTTIGPGNGLSMSGGGIEIEGNATLWILRSTVSGNHTGSAENGWVGFGGGIVNSGHLLLLGSAVVQNQAEPVGAGGGIFNGGTLEIRDSTVAGNTAGTLGGGIFNAGTVRLRGATVAGNVEQGNILEAPFIDGEFPDGCTRDDGGAECFSGGGGIWNQGTLSAETSLIAANSIASTTAFPSLGPDCSGPLTTGGHNLLGIAVDCTLNRSDVDLLNIDPLVRPLVVETDPGHAFVPLQPGSPAIDAGGRIFRDCDIVDQLGHFRTDGDGDGIARCDIGAIEFRR